MLMEQHIYEDKTILICIQELLLFDTSDLLFQVNKHFKPVFLLFVNVLLNVNSICRSFLFIYLVV